MVESTPPHGEACFLLPRGWVHNALAPPSGSTGGVGMSEEKGAPWGAVGALATIAGVAVAVLAWQHPRAALSPNSSSDQTPVSQTQSPSSLPLTPAGPEKTAAPPPATASSLPSAVPLEQGASPDQNAAASGADTQDTAGISKEEIALLQVRAPGAPPGGKVIVPGKSSGVWSSSVPTKSGFLLYTYVVGGETNQSCHRIETKAWEDCNGVGMTDRQIFDLFRFQSNSDNQTYVLYSYLPLDEPQRGAYWVSRK